MKQLRVIGYCRVSSAEQRDEGVSLAAQEARIRAFCGLHTLDLIGVEVDAGISGKSLARPGLESALRRLDAGEADGLVIAKLDRVTRSVSDWDTLIRSYFGPDGTKQLFSVADSIDTRSASGRMILNIMACIAQWEREAIVERTRDALRHKRDLGQRIGRVPYGSALADDGRTLIPDDAERVVIGMIRDMRDSGWGARAIARDLDARGIPSRTGRPWQASSIRSILARLDAAA